MGKEERIIFALGFVALVALVIFSRGPVPMTGNAPTSPPDTTANPVDYQSASLANYLTYNQPWLMAPPVANILPQSASGQLGQALPDADNSGDFYGCGCT
jgi:hypothetical protein